MSALHSDARISMPTGVVPSFRDFVRQIWRYRDENGASVLSPPPDIFTLVLDDDGDTRCVRSAVIALSTGLRFDDRVEMRWVNGSHHVVFHDLEALHTFLRALTSQRDERAAAEVAAFILGSLGFRWK